MPLSYSRSSSFSSRPSSSFKSSSSSFKSSSSSSKSFSSKSTTSKSTTSKSTSKSSSKSYSSGKKNISLKKPETKKSTEQKSTTSKTYKVYKPVSQTPVKEVHHYHNTSSPLDWMPFMFMADWLEDDDKPVIIQDGKVVNQPKDNGFTGLDFLSLFLSLAVVTVFGWSIWRTFKKNKKRGW
ncbi:hypothetical protein V7128_07450 [Neobacillus vireti]|uniref:hypothetical protein n=1 Tax=Neobacillus vireti TaxID=220686 RepID=UPI002FFF67D8